MNTRGACRGLAPEGASGGRHSQKIPAGAQKSPAPSAHNPKAGEGPSRQPSPAFCCMDYGEKSRTAVRCPAKCVPADDETTQRTIRSAPSREPSDPLCLQLFDGAVRAAVPTVFLPGSVQRLAALQGPKQTCRKPDCPRESETAAAVSTSSIPMFYQRRLLPILGERMRGDCLFNVILL